MFSKLIKKLTKNPRLLNSTPDLLNVLKFQFTFSLQTLRLPTTFTLQLCLWHIMWMNSMKCGISSTSSKSCVINNKTTSVSFGGKKAKNCYLKCSFWVFSPRRQILQSLLLFSYFPDTKSDYLGKKEVGPIRSIPRYAFSKIYYMYLQVYRKVNKFETLSRTWEQELLVLIQFRKTTEF